MTARPSTPTTASRTAVSISSMGSTSDLTALSSSEDNIKGKISRSGAVTATKKRARESGASTISAKENKNAKKVKVDNVHVKSEKGVYCHQQRCEAGTFIRCTKLKQKNKHVIAPCNHAFCDKDLVKRYGISPQAVRWEGTSNQNPNDNGTHDPQAEYVFECPCCTGNCQSAPCRKKMGLEPLGDLSKAAKAAGLPNTAALLDAEPKLNGNTNGTPNFKINDSKTITSVIELSDDSDLSDLDEPQHKKVKSDTPKSIKTKTDTPKTKPTTKGPTQTNTPKAKATPRTANSKVPQKVNDKSTPAKGTPTAKNGKLGQSGSDSTKKKVKDMTVGDTKKTVKGKGKGKEGEVKPKVVKKVEIPVEPPAFEKVDTKLGREEAEQRIMLREYLLRFRPVLSVPERALPAADDFDRPLTEASVRLFAGAMLDMIREELETQGGHEDLVEGIAHNREELRYYADLARFAAIYNSLASSLELRLPPAIIDTQSNDNALRALLDLDEDQATPAWATDLTAGPSRRIGASRIPQSSEVIRMLLAFAERTLSTPAIRSDMEYFPPENEARRRHATAVKKEVTAWEVKKKKLAEARVQCKSAAETKANKELMFKEQHEHGLRVSFQNVNLRAALSRRALRHEPIGIDLDGRVYYALNPRSIEDDGRPPLGWASGLLVWGKGVRDGDEQEQNLPAAVERWSHFGKSTAVKALVKWVEWRYEKAAAAALSNNAKSPAKPKGKGITTPSKAIPSKKVMTTPRQRTLLEVVIPTSNKRKSTSSEDESTTSSLTPPPTSGYDRDELLSLLQQKDYTVSKQTLEEQGREFVKRLEEVAEWLQVLEWKGMGEI